ncbi:MAG: beta-galactosidase [Victivallaceae bacterium]|nr:beta-galactosidase [Victivallaceae bacterium]
MNRENSKTAVLYDRAFAALDGNNAFALIREAFSVLKDVEFLSAAELTEKLDRTHYGLLVNPYGPYFPKNAWNKIIAFLEDGGNFLNIGELPFLNPLVQDEAGWRTEEKQFCYLKELYLNYYARVKKDKISCFEAGEAGFSEMARKLAPADCCCLLTRFSDRYDIRDEPGSSGPRDAVLQPLVYALDAAKRIVAAPVVAIERRQGRFAGGKWVFVTLVPEKDFYASAAGKNLVKCLAEFAAGKVLEFEIRPEFANYYPGEKPQLLLHLKSFSPVNENFTAELTITGDGGKIRRRTGKISPGQNPFFLRIDPDMTVKPGFYTVSAVLKNSTGIVKKYRTGFWGFDPGLLEAGEAVSCGENYFVKGGRPYPVIGTTYMSSESHRKFLFDPNPYVWDKDFRRMKEAGITMVRTGIWTGIRHIMFDAGVADEAVMRALDAFLMTARRYDITVIFTFFTFFPEAWNGENPYLDPRSIQAQKEYVAAIVQRYKDVKQIIWDLINEPCFGNPRYLFKLYPNYDDFEKKAWRDWLRTRHGSISALQAKWRCTPTEFEDFTEIELPPLSDFAVHRFNDQFIHMDIKPMRAAEYRLFTQYAFSNWVKTMKTTIRNSGSRALITAGAQGEQGLVEDPCPMFYAENLDFTCVHSWVLNDDLLTDSLLAKVASCPMLVQETGVMYQENPDGSIRYSEADDSRLLERKLAYAFGGNAAGAVQWQWETNVYKKVHHETGLTRADSSEKPQLETLRLAAAFIKFSGRYFKDKKDEKVLVVIPSSQMFSAREAAIKAVQKCLRVIHHYNLTPASCVGEYSLSSIKIPPPLLILPAARTFSAAAWKQLLELVNAGSTLLLTGYIESNEYRQREDRFHQWGMTSICRPVVREELVTIGDKEMRLTFERDGFIYADKGVIEGRETENLREMSLGKGKIIYCTHPVEVANDAEPVAGLYQYALERTALKLEPPFTMKNPDPTVLIRPVIFGDSILYNVISENSRKRTVEFVDQTTRTKIKLTLHPQRSAMFFIGRPNGELLTAWVHDDLQVGKMRLAPGGNVAIAVSENEISYMTGTGTKISLVPDSNKNKINLRTKSLFAEEKFQKRRKLS